MASLRNSALVAGIAQYAMFVLVFLKIAVVSRFLTPAELGAFTLASSVVSLAQFLRVFGTWDYIVAQEKLTEDQLRQCFTLIAVTGMVVFCAYMLAAEPLAAFFRAPEISGILWIMAPSFLILPIGTVTLAVMTRNMEFALLSRIRIGATLADTVVTIALILLNVGVLSLAIGYTAGNVVSVLMVVALRRGGLVYRPLLRGISNVVRFGSISALGTFLNAVGFSVPAILLGYGMTPAIVGVFGRGQALITFFRQGIEVASRPVTMAWFAKRARDGHVDTGAAYLRVTTLLAGFTWPGYIGLYFGAPTLVPLLLGNQWQDSVVITQILALGGMMSFYAVTGISIFEGHGHVSKRLTINLIIQGQRFLLLALALPHGLIMFTVALSLSHFVSFVLMSLFLRAETGLRFVDVLRSLVRSILVAFLMVALNLVLFSSVFASEQLTLAELGAYVLMMLAAWVGSIAIVRHPLWFELLHVSRRVFSRIRS